ncbi:RNA polymerase sigma factor [Niabella aquatica]
MKDNSIDQEYITKVCDGDSESFRFFINKYKNILFTYAFTILKDSQLAEEAVQDAFLNAFRYLKNFGNKSSFKTWLIKIAINEANRKKTQIAAHIILSERFNENLIDYSDSPELNDNIEIIQYALNRIAKEKGLVLRLFYIDEYSIKEIAGIMKWGIPKTKVTLHRAKKEIVKMVKELQSKKDEKDG